MSPKLRLCWLLSLCTFACNDALGPPGPEEEVAVPGEGQSGSALFRVRWGTERLSFVVERGHAIYEEDVNLGPVADLYATADSDPGAGGASGGAVNDLSRRWTNGTIHYLFDPAITDAHKAEIRAGLDDLDALVPLTFVEITHPSGNYVYYTYDFDQGSFGRSHEIGMAGGRQDISFKRNDVAIGSKTVKHEMLHAAGFFHEQGRPDRDWFVFVNYSCIDPDLAGNYDVHYDETVGLSPYDYRSIMHYTKDTACLRKSDGSCKCPTMMSWWDGGTSFSSNDLTSDDVNSVFLMYAKSGLVNGQNDNLGRSVVTGDFDDDNYADVAVGIPNEDIDGVANAGRVRIFKGTALGLMPWQSLVQTTNGGQNEPDDQFGEVLAVGDYDDDGFTDLAVGTPHEDIGLTVDSGAVFLYRGSRSGLVPAGFLTQTSTGVSYEEVGDLFGASLAFGDFTKLGRRELAVGTPQERNSWVRSGAVFLYHIDSDDSFTYKPTKITQAGLGTMDPNDRFGAALAARDLDGNGWADLVVGATEPGGTGAIYLFKGITPAAPTWSWGPMVQGVAELRYFLGYQGDLLGSALAIGNFDGKNGLDLAVGAPGRYSGQGRVLVWYAGTGAVGASTYAASPTVLSQATLSVDEAGDQLGFALAAGNFIGTNDPATKIDDLAVGAPGENGNAGQILLFQGGTSAGLLPKKNVRQIDFANADEEANDRFGASLAVGNIDRIGAGSITINPMAPNQTWQDIVVGAPGEGPDGDPSGSGTIFTILGDPSTPIPDGWYHQESPGGVY